MDIERVREIVTKIASIEDGPRLLAENPRALSKKLKLSSREMAAIFSGDLQLVHVPSNPLAGTTTYTFTTGTTITAGRGRFTRFAANSTTTYTFDTGTTITAGVGPAKVEDLTRDQLIRVLRRAVDDQEYAARLRPRLR